MDEEEKPPQAEARDKTVIAPPPEERPRDGAGRTRTAERKLQPSAEPPGAPARTRTVERKLQLSPELQAAPARTRTSERKLDLPSEPSGPPARTRTVERKLDLPSEPSGPPARTRTVERKLQLSPELQAAPARTRTSERKLALPPEREAKRSSTSVPVVRVEEEENKIPTAPTTLPGAPSGAEASADPDTLKDAPLRTLPGVPLLAEEAPPPTTVERTVMVRHPEPPASRTQPGALSAPPVELEAPPESPFLTLPGEPPITDKRPAIAVERTVMVRAPEAPTSSSPPTEEEPEVASGRTLPSSRKTQVGPERAETQPQEEEAASVVEGMKLGGYQLIRRIGAGGMGTVWLASQLSLDREVAVKILRPGFAGDPQFVYRFTQEAFAAAQLIHHNIVQIYDCGSDKQIHFFSMEFVDGTTLLALLKRGAALEPEVATGYVLQAARGLKFAHERGMVHRDIKPDNLLLNNNGIVKVADMGLVKLARAARSTPRPVTYIGKNPQEYAMGTPAYMAPEQVMNSSKVDARADIYSLGCTLYHLLTGRPPFVAESLNTVMDMHVKEAPLPPDKRNKDVPEALSAVVMRMIAKRPEERYQDMGEVIRALEGFLGVEGNASFAPREQHASLLERCVQEFNQSAWALRRRWLVFVLMLLTALGTGLAEWRLGEPSGLGVASFAGFSWLASFIMRGLLEKGALFLRFRQFVFQAPLITWLLWILLLGGAGYGLYHFGVLVPTVAMMGSALLVAIAFYLLVDRRVEAERRPPVSQVEQMLRSMRLRGLEESALRQFVCTYSGENWEAFYEALFGYDAKMIARERWGLNAKDLPREQHSAWRDPLIRWIDVLQARRRRRREQRQLKVLKKKKETAQAAQAEEPALPPSEE
ncbi:serine/threonine-protein kinase [Hyalangium rubrum]|uniref:Protein kinase n=1 Tax=Hyalangium rubrum TaxID=3103134 RepID=A0ABU5H0X4_9BACT|nr:protein kinase [Hyalangium sp. s54d21]MDY7227105.1 protein kinase [Hyalangium sp. s54d21]